VGSSKKNRHARSAKGVTGRVVSLPFVSPLAMCWKCDSIAPRCPWTLARCVEDFFAGWEQPERGPAASDDEFAETCAENGFTPPPPPEAPEADPVEPPTRLSIVRVGKSPLKSQTCARVAPWDPTGSDAISPRPECR
jgi:hypothetical protein